MHFDRENEYAPIVNVFIESGRTDDSRLGQWCDQGNEFSLDDFSFK